MGLNGDVLSGFLRLQHLPDGDRRHFVVIGVALARH
jgi:hypothetical protein